ncbi:hypothetical protein LFM09_36295 [Lentzea alba]|uniref:hypothetical protein n=1 Tax=Lentzea alba TaxID=2714351 RepID=UPI0039BF2EA2
MSSPNELNHRVCTEAAHASVNVPVVTAEDTADAALRGLLGKRFDSASVLAVCRGGALVGLLTVERLPAASPQDRIRDVVDATPPVVRPGADQEHVAWQEVQHADPAWRSWTTPAGSPG